MNTLFHAAPISLEPGSIILPGNGGRILKYFGRAHGSWRNEMALEAVRASFYPQRPSRLSACFACPDEQRLRVYAQYQRLKVPTWPPPVLYEVTLVEPSASQHVVDWNLAEPIPGSSETHEQNAHLYWTAGRWYSVDFAPKVQCAEVVTSSPLKIVRRLVE